MTEKFTKGEWLVGSLDTGLGYDSYEITFNKDGECIAEIIHNLPDAHLIAAAPEMYEMLKKVIEISCGNNEIEVADDLVNISNEIETLLAKARGEA